MTGHNRIPTKSSRFDFAEMSDEQFAEFMAGLIPVCLLIFAFIALVAYAWWVQ